MRVAMFLEKNNQYSVVCHTRIAEDCLENGEWQNTKEEAQDWVEEECWIFSGEGWICLSCNTHLMTNLSKTRRDKGLNSMLPDGWNDGLEVGIDTLR